MHVAAVAVIWKQEVYRCESTGQAGPFSVSVRKYNSPGKVQREGENPFTYFYFLAPLPAVDTDK